MKTRGFRLRRRGQRFFTPRGGPLGFAEFAGRLSSGLLWLDGWFTPASQGSTRVLVELAGREHEFDARNFCFSRSDLSQLSAAGQILILPLDVGDAVSLDAVHLDLGGSWYTWTGSRQMPIRPDLAFRLPEKVAAFSPEIEQAFRGFWLEVCAPAASGLAADPVLELNVATVERLLPPPQEEEEIEVDEEAEEEPPACVADSGQPLGLSLEQVIALDDHSLFLRGWWWDAEGVMEGLDIVPPAGGQEPILGAVNRTARPDVAELYRSSYGDRAEDARGFFGRVRLATPAEGHRGYRLELRTALGEAVQVGKRPPIGEPLAGRDVVFRSLPEDRTPDLELLRAHVVPAVEALQERCRQQAAVAGRFTFGELPASPEISLLVPVFRRLDLVEHQLAHLAGDPALSNCELIYVLDSPRLAPELEESLFHLSRLFGVPVRGLVLARHVGFAGAINAAVAEARGRRLVLLHSDVFPDRPGWIRAMAELADSSDKIGIVGPRLVYEDRALQHAGIYFSRERSADGLWSAVAFFKGLPERFPGAGMIRRVPAVGDACLMIDRALFEHAGGLRDVYAAADLEDADLCLRCREAGYESWYLPAATLYHVEGLSRLPGRGWLRNPWTELYNRYLFDRRWDEQIRELMAECQDEPAAR